jgi:hypothetical protein
MNKPRLKSSLLNAVVLGGLVIAIPTAIGFRSNDDEEKKAVAEPTKLAKDLLGTWVLVGTPDKVGEAPESGGRYKFITGRHWTITEADPETGKVVFHHGGTYTLDGDTYAETVEYANESTASLIKETFKFTIKVEGDTLTQTGIGNPFNEVWKRAK